MAETDALLRYHGDDSDQIHPVYANHNQEPYQPTPLQLYRNAIGIGPRTPYFSTSSTNPSAQGTFPRGLYARILSDHRKLQVEYYLFDALLTTSLLVQLVVGATLTVLGPSAGSHPRTITILGAVNTGVAGLLGLLKGNGLPDRLRKDGFELRKVLDYIEEMDAELASGVLLTPDDIEVGPEPAPSTNNGPLSPNHHNPAANPTTNGIFHNRSDRGREEVLAIVKQVVLKYEAARDTAENNRPDNYVLSGTPKPSPPVSPTGRI